MLQIYTSGPFIKGFEWFWFLFLKQINYLLILKIQLFFLNNYFTKKALKSLRIGYPFSATRLLGLRGDTRTCAWETNKYSSDTSCTCSLKQSKIQDKSKRIPAARTHIKITPTPPLPKSIVRQLRFMLGHVSFIVPGGWSYTEYSLNTDHSFSLSLSVEESPSLSTTSPLLSATDPPALRVIWRHRLLCEVCNFAEKHVTW